MLDYQHAPLVSVAGCYGLMVSLYTCLPSFISMMTTPRTASCVSFRLISPLTLLKFLVAANASRIFADSVLLARRMASTSKLAASNPIAAMESGIVPYSFLYASTKLFDVGFLSSIE